MIRPSPWTTIVFLILLGAVAIAACVVLLAPRLIVAYYEGLGGQATRHALGFELRETRVELNHRPIDLLIFTKVSQQGRLGRAGVRDGDTWVGLFFVRCGNDRRPDIAQLYELLAYAAQHGASMDVVPLSALVSDAQQPWWRSMRTVSIAAVPAR